MTESQGKGEKMTKRNGERNLLAFTGAAALLALAVNLAVSAFNSHRKKLKRKDLEGSNVRVNLSASEILKLADRVIAKSKQVHDAVASVTLDKVTYANVIAPLADLQALQFPLVQSCVFPNLVSASEDVHKASAEAERRIDAHILTCGKREDVYRVIKAFSMKEESPNPEARHYVRCLVRDFERNGLNLTVTKREETQRLKEKIDELSLQYIRNLSDDNTYLLFGETELDGLPLEYIKSLDKVENGKYKIRMKSHHVVALLEHCKVGRTRKMVATAYGKRRGDISLSALESLVELRHKYARLLGYSNYADYAVDLRMGKTSSKVFEFLEDVSASLTDLANRELTTLKELKKQEEGEHPFGIEDLLYYTKRVEEKQFDLDFGAIREHFPVDLVLSGIFKIIQDLFGLRFQEILDVELWHSDVSAFSVLDLSSGDLLGYFYLDLFAREGKYGHTCMVALQNSALLHTGARQVQHVCNRASFARFSVLLVDPDFVEIPAQVLENWCYESFSLKLISGFYKDITKPINEEICKSLKRWRYSFSALKMKQEILYCLFDQIIYSADNVDIIELFKHLHPKVMLGLPMLEGTSPASCFPRSAIGYEAVCYSRIWSEVFATDIFASKFRDALLDHRVGMLFRNKVLAPGGSKEPIETLTDFLGREPSIQTFIDIKTGYSL